MQFNYSHALSDQEVGHYCICNNSLHTNTAKRANDEGWDHSLTTRLSVRIFQVDLDLKKEQQIVSRTVAFFEKKKIAFLLLTGVGIAVCSVEILS